MARRVVRTLTSTVTCVRLAAQPFRISCVGLMGGGEGWDSLAERAVTNAMPGRGGLADHQDAWPPGEHA